MERRQLLATLIVNTAVDTNSVAFPALSLREAIEIANGTLDPSTLSAGAQAQISSANSSPGRTYIGFDIAAAGLQTISLNSALPAITSPVFIDGYSEPGALANSSDNTGVDQATLTIQLDGIGAGAADGLTINAANSIIAGLEITRFQGNAIVISGATALGNFVEGNFIGAGTDPTNGSQFTTGLGNSGSGLLITSSNNRIGGDNAALRNVILGNGVGVTISGAGGSGNLVQGNFILDNAQQGMLVSASNNTIGEVITGGGNYISGNGAAGVEVTGGPTAQGNIIVGNDIGPDIGVGSGSGTISPAGVNPRGNGGAGILLENSPNNTVGSLNANGKNVIAANEGDGIDIDGAASTGNTVLNNWIGFNITNSLESLAIPNLDGIKITSSGNIIGGTTPAAANVVDLNLNNGIELSGTGAFGNTIEGNIIGLNPGGGTDFGNAFDGIHIVDAGNNTIGGTATGQGNTISGNNNGVVIINTGGNGPSAASGNVLEGNFIGTGTDGVTDLGNSVDGVVLQGAPSNTIGGTASGAGNVISGNNRGVRITGTGATGNLVQGNFIGTDLTASDVIHNKVDGVIITAGASNNTIGGAASGAANTIAYNVGNGVRVESGTGNAILGNSIFSNNQIGINLVGGSENAAGVTANSAGGPHVGPNDLQNYPVLTTVAPNGSATFIQGSFNSTPNTTFTIQFFSTPTADSSGFGEGKTLLGSTALRTDAAGNATLQVDLPSLVPVGQYVAATATDSNNNTSEFSQAVASTPTLIPSSNPATIFVNTALDENDPTNSTLSLREAIELTNGTLQLSALNPLARAQVSGTPGLSSQDTIEFAIPGSGTQTIFVGATPLPGGGFAGPLPAITHAVNIEGLTQNTSSQSSSTTSIVVLDGTSAGPTADGLTIMSNNSQVSGLTIVRFGDDGIVISSPPNADLGHGNWVYNNYIGITPELVSAGNFTNTLGNGHSGILVSSSNNLIGFTDPTHDLRNVIVGNSVGVTLAPEVGLPNTPLFGTGNIVEGNQIQSNVTQGVLVESSNNTIGNDGADLESLGRSAILHGANFIANNGADGIEILGPPTVQGNLVLGNYINDNAGNGMLIENSPKNTIGGLHATAANFIYGNQANGILIDDLTSVISATGNQVENNWIGFEQDLSQNPGDANNLNGIRITSSDNIIGTAGAGNVISQNRADGVLLDGPNARGNVIQANIIGLDHTGTEDIGNTLDGIHIVDASNNVIGGTDAGDGNTISGNNQGVYITNTGLNGPTAASGNMLEGNNIGTGLDGVTDLANSVDDVTLDNAPGNTIGGIATGAGNVISGSNRGVRITGAGATGNLVEGNFIGTDRTGTVTIHNKIDGVLILNGASNNTIGGIATGAGNTIAFNVGSGVFLDSTAGTGNAILSNSIYGNHELGINLVASGESTAIGLETPNTPGGANTGPNDLTNHPVLTTVSPNGNATFIKGAFNGTPNTTYTVQFFSSLTADPSGFGQGQTLIGTTKLRTDGSGNATISLNVPTVVNVGQFVSATATDSSNNTSEFSNAVQSVLTLIPSANPATIYVTTDQDENDPSNATISLREAIELTDGTLQVSALSPTAQGFVFGTPNGSGQDSIEFAIPGSGLQTIFVTSALPAITHAVNIDGLSQPGASLSTNDKPDADFESITVQVDGSSAGAGANGLTINAANSTIDGLMITNFSGNGIEVSGANAQGNWLLGNFIGTSTDPVNGRDFPSGMGNGGSGILITSSNNRIGGDTAGLRNVISTNGVGITISGTGGTGNLIQGNFILDNKQQGVLVSSSNNTIGEAQTGGGNDIAGNGAAGIEITGGPQVQGNTVVGNNIGTDVGINIRGLTPRPNDAQGILIENSPNNTIGGTLAAAKNVIAANELDGILIDGSASTGNRVLNNWIGFNIVNSLESLNIPNNLDGIHITSAGNVIGGATTTAANVIAINRQHGIELTGPGASGNSIEGNIIGLNPGGGSDFGNTLDGIHIVDAANNIIGGTASGDGNTISGNNNGIVIINSGANGPGAATGNIIAGNFIGTGTDGVTDLGNSVDGVVLQDAPRNTIGGTTSAAANVIAGNNRGIRITGAGALGNVVEGNFVGTDLTGTDAIHNKVDGIIITNGASSNLIGGTADGTANTIAFNVGNGVRVESGTGNSILGNSIYSNNQIGINLVGGTEDANGVTANSPGGPHTGANDLQNHPVLTNVVPNGNATFIQGTFNSTPNTTFTLQFFSVPSADPSGSGQGETYVGSTQVTTDNSGTATIGFNAPATVQSGQFVSATATDPNGNTSEFSNTLPAVPVSIQFNASTYSVHENDGTATVTITRTGGTGGAVSVSFATSNGTATAGTDYTATSGPVFFTAGQTSQTVTIPIINDNVVESTKTVNLTLVDPTSGASLGSPSTATLTIIDDDQAGVEFSASGYSVNENAGTATITVDRNTNTGSLTVNYATSNGSAVAGTNYKSASGVLTFSPGQTSTTFTVPVIDNHVVGGSLTVNLGLSNPSSGTIGSPGTAVLTINENDKPGSLSFNSATYGASNTATKATLTVTRNGGSGGEVTVAYNTAGGNAVPGVDYVPASGTLNFKPGETTKTITITLLNDTNAVNNRTLGVVLTSPTGGATMGTPRAATLTIAHGSQQGSSGGSTLHSNPNAPGPIVTDLNLLGGAGGITGILLSFNQALDATRAQNVASYGFFVVNAGRDGAFGTSDDVSVHITKAVYSAATHQVLLTPATALPLNSFDKLTVNGNPSNTAGITNLAGNLLDGDGNGFAGGVYQVSFGLGNRFVYTDGNGDVVSLSLANGGLMELRRGPSGEAQQLQLELTVPRRSVLSGQVRRTATGDGQTTIPSLVGAAGVTVKLGRAFHIGGISAAGMKTPAGPRGHGRSRG